MKKYVVFIGLVLLIFSLVLPSCSSAPAPSAPAPATSSVPNAAAQHAPVTLLMYSNPTGSLSYVLSFALADIINKNSKWLKINPFESTGSLENLQAIMKDKTNTVVGCSTTMGIDQLALGVKPFDGLGPATPVKWLSIQANICTRFVTLNPNIKTPADLAGKRVGLDTIGSSDQYVEEWLMEYAWHVKDQVKISYGNTTDLAVDRLLDNTLDVTYQGSWALGGGTGGFQDWTPSSTFERLVAAKQVYFVNVMPADMDIVRKQTGIQSVDVIGLMAKTVGQTNAPQTYGMRNCLGWIVPNSMDDAVVTEMISIIYDHASEFGNYHVGGKAVTKEFLGTLPVFRDAYHPAVVKFLESKGLKVGK